MGETMTNKADFELRNPPDGVASVKGSLRLNGHDMMDVYAYMSETSLVICEQPGFEIINHADDSQDEEWHNCDLMGCGYSHVMLRFDLKPDQERLIEATGNPGVARIIDCVQTLEGAERHIDAVRIASLRRTAEDALLDIDGIRKMLDALNVALSADFQSLSSATGSYDGEVMAYVTQHYAVNLAGIMCAWFEHNKASSFMEIHLDPTLHLDMPTNSLGVVRFTMSRVNGPTAVQLLAEACAERDTALAEVDAIRRRAQGGHGVEGTIEVGVDESTGSVTMQLPDPERWVAFSPAQARAIAASFMRQADKAETGLLCEECGNSMGIEILKARRDLVLGWTIDAGRVWCPSCIRYTTADAAQVRWRENGKFFDPRYALPRMEQNSRNDGEAAS